MQNKTVMFYGLILAQIIILAGMFAKAFYPLASGTEIKMRVQGYDPRDIFRGNYSNLAYDFSSMALGTNMRTDLRGGDSTIYYFGDALYIELAPDSTGKYYKTVGLWKNKPQQDGLFLKATPESEFNPRYEWLNLHAGIENFFSSPEKATEIDQILNRSDTVQVYAILMVAPNGTARIKDLGYEVIDKEVVQQDSTEQAAEKIEEQEE
jgi:uncharacterized membrane-anchored protein